MVPHKRTTRSTSKSRVTILEKNVYSKKVTRGTIRVALAYPSSYQVAMSSLSIHLLYHFLNKFDDIYAERVVMEGEGPYRSLETGTPLKNFDIVMFSVHYELDYVNIARMLLESGIPVRVEERKDGKYPVIIVGGPTVTANPEPLAEIADIIVVGEAEPLMEQLVENIALILDRRLVDLASERGIYVPSLGKHEVRYVYVGSLDLAFYPTKQIVVLEAPEGYVPIFGRAFFLEVVRGCPFMCKFCMESHVQFPFRLRSYCRLIEILEEGLEHCPVDKIVLIGLGTQSHPDIKKLCRDILERGLRLSFPSLRADKLDSELLELLVRSGQDVLTVAPESSERLRYAVGKYFTDSELYEVCLRGIKLGIQHLKLYFIVGFPGELDADIESCVQIIEKVREIAQGKVYVSVNPWIRKPQTPLQYFSPTHIELVESRVKMLVRQVPARHSIYDPVLAWGQMLLSLGDRDVSSVILRLASSRANPLARSTWRRLLVRECPELFKKYVTRQYSSSDVLPWSHVKLGLSEKTIVKKAQEYAERVNIRWC